MRRLYWPQLDAVARQAVLRRPGRAVEAQTCLVVTSIIDDVRMRGDVALRELCRRFDGVAIGRLAVSDDELSAASDALSGELKAAISTAAHRIEHFHRAGVQQPYAVDTADGVVCERIVRPIARVGLYVPAGSAPLPSTALMLGIPARIAGCGDVVMCTPPRADGSADPSVLYAARQCGISRVFKVGGAQAIAAMALGTDSVPRCYKIFGPGNAFVTEAKRQVSTLSQGVAIDMAAGPSEVLVIADRGANAQFVAADLLSQAEHGADSHALLISDDDGLIEGVEIELAAQLARLPRRQIANRALSASLAILVDTLDEATIISNEYAPEHLILAVRDTRRWLEKIEAAGSVFLGDWAPEALGDYCSGTNHVLPTGGAARAVGGLCVSSFQNAISVQAVSRAGLNAIGPTAMTIAHAEGLDAHARAVSLRMEAA